MSEDRSRVFHDIEAENPSTKQTLKSLDRRRFLGQAGAAATIAAGAMATPTLAFAQSSGAPRPGRVSPPAGVGNNRIVLSFENRVLAATREALIPPAPLTTN